MRHGRSVLRGATGRGQRRRTAVATTGAVLLLAVVGGSLESLGSSASAAPPTAPAASPSTPASGSPSPGDGVDGVDAPQGIDGGSAVDSPLPTPPALPPTSATPTPSPGGDVVVAGDLTIPARVLQAYMRAATQLSAADPGCHLPWQLLAAIGRIESDHAWDGDVDAAGRTLKLIVGPELDGSPGVAAIHDTDHGRWDGDKVWDRAVGPMQFIPSTWAVLGRDGEGDRVANPSDVDDATLSAAWYLCGYGRDLSGPGDLRQAIHGYNHSDAYVTAVLAWQQAYTVGTVVAVPAAATSTSPTPPVAPTPTTAPSPTAPPSATPLPTLPGPRAPGPVVGHRVPDPFGSGSPSPTPTGPPGDCPSAAPIPTPSDGSTAPATDPPTATPTPTDPVPSGCPTPSATDSPGASESPTALTSPTDPPVAGGP
jgi:membrane-bound lytic murein transglycosylase B